MFRCALALRTAAVLMLLMVQGVFGGETSISVVPIGTGPNGELAAGAVINGNAITLTTDGINPVPIFLEFRIGDWDPADIGVTLAGYQPAFDSSSLMTGASGALTFNFGSSTCGECSDTLDPCSAVEDCTPGTCSVSGGSCRSGFILDCPSFETCLGAASCDAPASGNDVCEAELGTGALCGPPGYFLGSGTCSFAYVDMSRADFVFADAPAVLLALDSSSPDVRPSAVVIGAALGDPEPFPAEGLYGATLALLVPPNAQGTFTISLKPSPASALLSGAGPPITPLTVIPAQIRVNPGRCCFKLNLRPFGRDDCFDGLTQTECDAQPGVTDFEAGAICSDGCPNVCGDNLNNQLSEECDGTDDSVCPGMCLDNCQCGFCGDDIQTGTEECDGTDDAACPGSCLGDCTCGPFCGDDLVNQVTEECDGTDAAACVGICLGDCTCNPTCGDGDGNADMLGVAIFMNCFTGPGGGPVTPECQCAEFDADDDIDLDDFLGFFNTLNGP